ncbi:site-2 protease family protein [Microbacterium mitrae]|uniref:Site-2 protease family protein n=1 Tax=Microbacterium mitrae TaxID=664640 RepID=A0A5C8HP54_9MICO|nr:site-2 protease family protein [Microbacterium mitrae]TXK04591.1 site-2 protease family protein [Microbacterium mitrae]
MTVLAFIIGILVIVVGLAVSIALHEIGHLVPAKLFKVRVGQYMIGFGPTLWSKKFGETEYGFKAIPLGGYISMAGMYPPASGGAKAGAAGGGFFRTMVQDARDANEETLGEDERVFYKLPTWKRVIIMLGGPLMNLLFAGVLFTIILSGIGVQQSSTTIATINECVIPASSQQTECTPSDPASPAAAAGLLPGDTITAIDGEPVSSFVEISSIIRDNPDTALAFSITRPAPAGAEAQPLTIDVTPMLAQRPAVDADGNIVTDEDGTVQMVDVGFVGFGPQQVLTPQPLSAGVEQTVANVGAVAGIMVELPVKLYNTAVSLVTGGERDPNGPISVVGVGRIAGEVATIDAPIATRVAGVLSLVASLNIALFVFNLIPLLPLDGGHVVVALWDAIKRGWAKLFRRPAPKPVDATKLVPLTFVVVIALVGMGALLLIADIVNPVQLF